MTRSTEYDLYNVAVFGIALLVYAPAIILVYQNVQNKRGKSLSESLLGRADRARLTLSALAFAVFIHVFSIGFVFNQCPIHDELYESNSRLGGDMIDFLNSQPFPYWIDWGSLLDIVRENDMPKRWDPDTDFAMVHPAAYVKWTKNLPQEEADQVFEQWLADLHEAFPGAIQEWHSERGLFQTYRDGAHTDIWILSIGKTCEEALEYTKPETWGKNPDSLHETPFDDIFAVDVELRSNPNCYKLSIFFPPQIRNGFIGRNVSIPAEPNEVVKHHFGENYMTPLIHKFECFEHVWHGKAFIRFRTLVAAALLFSGFVYFILGRSPYVKDDLVKL